MTRTEQIEREIRWLLPTADSGEKWAHICALEAEYVRLTGKQLEL